MPSVYLISRKLCENPTNGDKIWPDDACTSTVAEIATSSGGITAPEDYSVPSLEDFNWDGSSIYRDYTAFGFNPRTMLAEARSDLLKAYHDQPTLEIDSVEPRSQPERASSVSRSQTTRFPVH
jgi:hypothetical protein